MSHSQTGGTIFVISGDFKQTVYQAASLALKDTVDGAEAAARLAELPLETLPPLAPALPVGSRLPLAPNQPFFGQEDDLHRLTTILKGAKWQPSQDWEASERPSWRVSLVTATVLISLAALWSVAMEEEIG